MGYIYQSSDALLENQPYIEAPVESLLKSLLKRSRLMLDRNL